MTPVYFGSALKNFGVDVFLDALANLAPSPRPRASSRGPIDPISHPFTGFVFKIQANMDPQHRDRMAFLRICSGRFEKDMTVYHTRLERKLRMGRVHRLFARDRETVGEAYAGDIVGVVDPGVFCIGDTVCLGEPVQFDPVPRFQPEMFGMLRNLDVAKSKQFRRGVDQLEEEGVVQIFYSPDAVRREPVVAAVGALQFDVLVSRLQAEYGVTTRIDSAALCLRRLGEGRAGADSQDPLALGRHHAGPGSRRPAGLHVFGYLEAGLRQAGKSRHRVQRDGVRGAKAEEGREKRNKKGESGGSPGSPLLCPSLVQPELTASLT